MGLIIDLRGIGLEGRRLTGEETDDILEMGGWEDVRDAGPLRYDLAVSRTGDTLLVRGTLAIDLNFRCSRCADFFAFHARVPSFDCVRELAPGVESVDLTEDIRETILLSFPNYPVCRADCKGLCPQCGASRNQGRCGCDPSAGNRWGMLDNLKIG